MRGLVHQKRIEANKLTAERNAEYTKKICGKYHRLFATKDGIAVLDDLKAQAGGVQVISFDVTIPFSPERYYTREGFRQAVGWIMQRIVEHEEREGDEDGATE